MITDHIIFEQPLNEQMRICLRLEHLFQQLHDRLHGSRIHNHRACLAAILQILDVINRPDVKSKLTQALTQHACSLSQLERFPQVDTTRLQNILEKLDRHISHLHKNHQKLGEPLSSNHFLNHIRLQMANPGGACNFNTPAYTLWQHQDPDRRLSSLQQWATTLDELHDMINLNLQITRDSTPLQTITCNNGFYHQNLNPALPCQLIRAAVPQVLNVYPEFSVGRHRLTIRLVTSDFGHTGQVNQITQDVEMLLSCCRPPS